MSARLKDVYADALFWVALLLRTDQHNPRALAWSKRIGGRITTTDAVLIETLNAMARPVWRAGAVALFDELSAREDVTIVHVDPALWSRGYDLYRQRPDKGWGLTDCISFVVMAEQNLSDALTADAHFQQAGYRALLLEAA